jgi:MFS transporter, DHA1 family, solute carrier family 18 (vesicular amine transporter), member 1/2
MPNPRGPVESLPVVTKRHHARRHTTTRTASDCTPRQRRVGTSLPTSNALDQPAVVGDAVAFVEDMVPRDNPALARPANPASAPASAPRNEPDTFDPTDATDGALVAAPKPAPIRAGPAQDSSTSPLLFAATPRRALVQAVLLGAFGLDMLLYSLVVPFLPGRAQALGASPLGISALFATYAGALLLATPPAGWCSDRFGARRTLLVGLIALAMATLLFAFAPGLPLLVAARGAQGLAGALTWTAGLALIAELYDGEARLTVFARIFSATGVGTLIGPPLGGALYAWGGFRAPFLAAAALVLLDGVGRVLVLPRRAPPPRREATDGMGARLRDDRGLVTALVATLAGAALLAQMEPSLPVLLTARFDLGPLPIGLLFGGLTILFIALQPAAALLVRRLGAEVTVIFGLAIGAAALLLLARSYSLLGSALALATVALGVSLIVLPSLQLFTLTGPSRHVSPETHPAQSARYGAAFATYNLAYSGGLLLGPLLAGAAITWMGLSGGFVLLSVPPALLGAALTRRRLAAQHQK